MTTTVNFSFPQIIPTDHPLHEREIEFYGLAQIAYENDIERHCIINTVFVKTVDQTYLQGEQLPVTQLDKQNEATGEMARFLDLCREAARKEYHAANKDAVGA
jgi:hypothetical protein